MTPLVLALSRRGLPMAEVLARSLHGDADVLVIRKLGLPWRGDVCMGAVVEGGDTYLDQRFIDVLHISDEDIAEVAERQYLDVEHLASAYRGDRPRADMHDRTVVVLGDDHTRPGTMQVALRAARAGGASHVVLAAPSTAIEPSSKSAATPTKSSIPTRRRCTDRPRNRCVATPARARRMRETPEGTPKMFGAMPAPARIMEPATREELEELLGDLDPITVARILDVRASFDDVAEALAELENPDAAAHWPASPIVHEVRGILLDALVSDDAPLDNEQDVPSLFAS